MKPLGARLDDCEAAVGRDAKRRQEAEDMSAAEKTCGSEDSIAQMNASLVRVLSEMKGSQFVEAHEVAEAEKLMESLSVGLSRVAQLARHEAESQMKVETSVGTPKATARGGRNADWTPAQQPDRRRPRITGKTSVDEHETRVQGFQDANQGGMST